jgi:hypothetical protein
MRIRLTKQTHSWVNSIPWTRLKERDPPFICKMMPQQFVGASIPTKIADSGGNTPTMLVVGSLVVKAVHNYDYI